MQQSDSATRLGGWYLKGHEKPPQAAVRARRVAAWLRHDQPLHDEMAGSDAVVVLVMHGGFIGLLLQELLGSAHDFPNTATALLDITPDGEVRATWVGDTAHLLQEKEGGAQAHSSGSRRKLALAAFSSRAKL